MDGRTYSIQKEYPILGASLNSSGTITLAPVTLTAAYTGNISSAFNITTGQQLTCYLRYITGSGETNNSVEVRVEFSPDGTLWYQEVDETVASGTSTVTLVERTFVGASAATTYSLRFAVPVADKFIRFALKETGVVTNFGTGSLVLTVSS